MKLAVRGDVPIIQMTFGTMMPDGVKDVVCIQTTIEHAQRIASVLAAAAAQGPSLAKAHVELQSKQLPKGKGKKATAR